MTNIDTHKYELNLNTPTDHLWKTLRFRDLLFYKSWLFLFISQVFFKPILIFWRLAWFLSLNSLEQVFRIYDIFMIQHELDKLKFNLNAEIFRHRNIRIKMLEEIVAESIEADFVG